MSESRLDGQEPLDGLEVLGGQEPSEFELQLTRALERVEAPVGFAARVMECAAVSSSNVVVMRPRLVGARMWAAGAIAAMLLVGGFVGEQLHVRHQREEAALATQQFEAASRIEDKVLQQTRERLAKAGVRLE